MSTTTKVVSLTTDVAGNALLDVRIYGVITGLGIRIGTLSTPDVTITDGLTGAPVYADTGLTTDVRVQPRVLVQDEAGADIAATYDKPVITGILRITVAGGGNAKTGEVVIVHE